MGLHAQNLGELILEPEDGVTVTNTHALIGKLVGLCGLERVPGSILTWLPHKDKFLSKK